MSLELTNKQADYMTDSQAGLTIHYSDHSFLLQASLYNHEYA